MSVEAVATIRRRPYPNPGNDPRLPISIWYTQGAVIGDASGGHMEIVIELNNAAAQRSGRSWSLELSLVQRTDENTFDFRIASNNLDVLGPGLSNPIQKSFVQIVKGVSTSIENPESAIALPGIKVGIYLGSQGGSASAARLQGQAVNVNGATLGWYATGYEWEPAANWIGHLKPIDGLI